MAGDSGPMLDTRSTGPAINVDGCSDSYHQRFATNASFALIGLSSPGWSTCPWCAKVERTVAQKRALAAHYPGNTPFHRSNIVSVDGTPLDGCWEWTDNGWTFKRYAP